LCEGKKKKTIIDLYVVIPNAVRNLSGYERTEKEGFLGAQRASE
jgi:hypothetical protein